MMSTPKIFKDTLQDPKTGKWSRKSLTAFFSFIAAIGYEFLLPFFGIDTKEYVFLGFLGLAGGTLYLTVKDKLKNL